jgi:predicted AlkP superfamily phosphohydrolase/phosphomutase
MLIGIDGLEWDLMKPLIDEERLPAFARLLEEGTWGEVHSLDVLESPVIWTSIGTGKVPEKHGVLGFVKHGDRHEQTPVTRNVRRVKTVWEILGENGASVGVIGWLATWPATPVNGYLVSNYFVFEQPPESGRTSAITFPEGLSEDLSRFVVREDDVDDSRAAEFTGEEVPHEGPERVKFDALKGFIASDETIRRTGLHLGGAMPVDFFTVYLRAVDSPCHIFWVDSFPESGQGATAESIELFGEVIPRYYEYMDEVLADFLELADENTTVIVTSDHGFEGPERVGDAYHLGIRMHDPTGFIAFAGKDIVAGGELADASVLDITPTILALMGMPVADDMDGRVLAEAIDPSFLRAHPVTTVDTYEDGDGDISGESDEEPIESPLDDEVREQLRSLGYIE